MPTSSLASPVMGTVESRQRHQMHLVQHGVNKGVQIRDPEGKICGSVVRRRVVSCIEKMQETKFPPPRVEQHG